MQKGKKRAQKVARRARRKALGRQKTTNGDAKVEAVRSAYGERGHLTVQQMRTSR